MTPVRPVTRDDRTHDFLLGVAAVSALLAALLVGLEARSAFAGGSVDALPLVLAAALVATTVGGVAHRRRELDRD